MSKKHRNDHDGKIAGLYDLEDTIGRGHFAVVKLARHVFTGEKVAVKVIDKTKLDDVSKAHLFQEVRCMKLVQHPNVVRLYEVIDTQTKLYLILELGDGGDLYDYIMKHDGGLKEPAARTYFRQIVEAISYCHKLHVVHRDLKPENVVFFEKLGLVKLTDFGFSNMFNPGYKLETSCGSLAYSAPEILLGDSYDAPAVDVWSLGVILYMLVCGTPPFQEANDSETLTMIMDCKYQVPSHISSQCRDLINLMLKREPSNRASLEEIILHPWLMGGEFLPPSYMPLISREQISEEDHSYLVQRMVEGKIATREEILSSLDKGSYNHITATYYLLAERRLKRHQLFEQQLAGTGNQLRKPSIPNSPQASSKPHLEPLSLSPRKLKGLKKTKTAPLGLGLDLDSLNIKPLQGPASAEIGSLSRPLFVKSITGTMTLDRKDSLKKRQSQVSPITPDMDTSRLGELESKPETQEVVKKKSTGFSKIAILSSFFERKAGSSTSGKSPVSEHKSGHFWNAIRKKRQNPDSQPKEPMKPSYIQSLVSPPGTHPSPSLSLAPPPSMLAPAAVVSIAAQSPEKRFLASRKYSLIKEESQEESAEELQEEMEIGHDIHVQPVRTYEDIEEQVSSHNIVGGDGPDAGAALAVRWPLMSVSSSPQLLNQIFEENESDEDDDFVPDNLHAPHQYKANSMASPEILRKYEQRKKRRGAGQRGTSCSSSDASDTDDTEGRSRKDKLKHKFVHRRDSSDHSSDTDGPGGQGGDLGGGAQFGGGGGSSHESRDGNKRDSGKKDSSGGKGSKGGGGGHGSKQNHAGLFNLEPDLDSRSFTKKLAEISMTSLSSNSSAGSAGHLHSSRLGSDGGHHEKKNYFTIGCSPVQYLGQSGAESVGDTKSFQFSEISEQSDCGSLCSSDCVLGLQKKGMQKDHKVQTDINRNGVMSRCCPTDTAPKLSALKVESKCCSVV
ncbi:SNF-related serine/threonine-protein kinase-like isoform X2 [Gigantopelta aegis]|uniref:SNF-related serine/threonine-protein kinase-like isoform X2 n=1 Tax=Gigantopelta aegis TaxID=1735272 RepID=UPI001B8893F2|nr:SNF-related serine/threonine-protein kinase-like isoform X2 [Gigantopelta aegis]